MSEEDTPDPKPASAKEIRALFENRTKAFFETMARLAWDSIGRTAVERAFREGVLAGLLVREIAPDMAAYRMIEGPPEDLMRVRPMFCLCDPTRGNVCSPRRRPAECPTAEALEREWDPDGD